MTIPTTNNSSTKTFKFWNLEKNEANNSADLMLYGDIMESAFREDEIGALDVVKELNLLSADTINIHINSNGGGVYAAVAIANTIKQHKAKVNCYIDGIVASAATIITSACDAVKMPRNAIFMIHNPWTVAMGTADDMKKNAETLEKIKNSILETYADKTGLEKEFLSELMNNETFMNADEALEYGFIDEIIENTDLEIVENKIISNGIVFNMGNFKNFDFNSKFGKNRVSNQNSGIDRNQNNGGSEKMTKEELKEKFPDVYDSILEDGKIEERARIKELEDLGIENEIVNAAKFENPKNAKDIALDLLKAQNSDNTAVNTQNSNDISEIIAAEVKKALEAQNKGRLDNIKNENKPLSNNPKTENKSQTVAAAILNKMYERKGMK